MQNLKTTKTITAAVQVHKELKKAEVEGIFTMPGVTFEVKRRTVYATKEVSSYSEKWNVEDQSKEWAFEVEVEAYVLETMENIYLEKCYAMEAEHERKALATLEEEEKKAQKEKSKIVELTFEEFCENICTVEIVPPAEHDRDEHVQKINVYAVDIFLYFLSEELEKYGANPFWYRKKKKIIFDNVLEYADQPFEESLGFACLEEAKEKFREFFGDEYEAQEKISMLLKNEEIFKNIYDLDY